MHTLNLDKFQKNFIKFWFTEDCKQEIKPRREAERLSNKTIGLLKQFSHCSGKSHHIFTE